MASFPSSYISTVASTVTRAAEQLQFPFPWKPQAMTLYVKFEERGTIATNNGRIVSIADTGARLQLFSVVSAYRVEYVNAAGASVTSQLAAAPVLGDSVELRAVLFSDGAVQAHQSINGAAETSAAKSAALALESAWNTQVLWLNSQSTTNVGFNAFISVKIATGEQSLSVMRSLRTAMGSGP